MNKYSNSLGSLRSPKSLRRSTQVIIGVSLAIGSVVTVITHHRVSRPDKPKPFGPGGGTTYLNRLLSQPEVGDLLEIDPADQNQQFVSFCKIVSNRCRQYFNTSATRYDVWFIGFSVAKGWPIVTKVPFVRVYIDEYDVNNSCAIEYHFECDDSGESPVRFAALLGNVFAISSVSCLVLIPIAHSWRRLRISRIARRRGFPLIPVKIPMTGEDTDGK